MTREELIEYYDSYFKPSAIHFVDGFEYERVYRVEYLPDGYSIIQTWQKTKVESGDSKEEFLTMSKNDTIRAKKITTQALREMLLDGTTLYFNTGKVKLKIEPTNINKYKNTRELTEVNIFVNDKKYQMGREAKFDWFDKSVNWERIRKDYHELVAKLPINDPIEEPPNMEEYKSTMGYFNTKISAPSLNRRREILWPEWTPSTTKERKSVRTQENASKGHSKGKHVLPKFVGWVNQPTNKNTNLKKLEVLINKKKEFATHDFPVRLLEVKSNKIIPVARIITKGKHDEWHALWLTKNKKDRYDAKKHAITIKQAIAEFKAKESKSERRKRHMSYKPPEKKQKRQFERTNQWTNTTLNLPKLSKRLQERLKCILDRDSKREKFGVKGYVTREQERREIKQNTKRQGVKPYKHYQTIEWYEVQKSDYHEVKRMVIDETKSTPQRKIYKWVIVEVPYEKRMVKTGTKQIKVNGKRETIDILEEKPVVKRRKTILVQHFSPNLRKKMHKVRVQQQELLDIIRKQKEEEALKKAKSKQKDKRAV